MSSALIDVSRRHDASPASPLLRGTLYGLLLVAPVWLAMAAAAIWLL